MVINCTKCNKTNRCVNTYPSPSKATDTLDSKVNTILINENTRVLRSNKDLKNLKDNDTLHKLDGEHLVTNTCENTQSEITAELSDPELSGAFLNSVKNSSFKSKKEGRVTVVAKQGFKKQPRIKLRRDSNTLLGVAPVMQSSKFY